MRGERESSRFGCGAILSRRSSVFWMALVGVNSQCEAVRFDSIDALRNKGDSEKQRRNMRSINDSQIG